MRPIAGIAKALLPDVPAISNLRLKDAEVDSEELVAAAHAMKDAAAPYSQVFTEHGRPAEFLDQLTAAADSLKAAIDARGRAGNRRKGATKAVKAEVKRGRRAVELIDAVIRPVILNDAKLLGDWQSAKRIGKKQGGVRSPAKKSTPNGSSATTPPSAPAMAVGSESEQNPAGAAGQNGQQQDTTQAVVPTPEAQATG